MIQRCRPLAVALCASGVMLVAVGTASANRLSFTNSGIRIVWGEMAFVGEGATGGFTVRCPVTLEGNLHSATIVKVTNTLIGYITRAAIGECEGGRVRLLTETLPWHIRYESFSGTLPRITGISFTNVGMSWLVEPTVGVSCLYRSTSEQPARGELALGLEGEINRYSWAVGARIPLVGGLLCPSVSWMTGNGTVTLLGSTVRIRARLI